MKSLNHYLLEVTIHIDGNWSGVLFTGKLVKSLLIDANPKLKSLFKKSSGPPPKLVHITPLYTIEEGNTKESLRSTARSRCIYSYAQVDTIKGQIKKVYKVHINRGLYRFYVGFIETPIIPVSLTFDTIYNTLLNMGGTHKFKQRKLDVELVSLNVLDVIAHTSKTVDNLITSGKLKLIFSSPTLLRDPLRTAKHKSLIPVPINIFSTPAYIDLYLLGKLRKKELINRLILLHRLLNEPYSVHNTTSVKWVLYDIDKKPIPTLIGYVNLYLNRTYYEDYNRKYDIDELLRRTIATISTLGTGTSRAVGFGHVLIK